MVRLAHFSDIHLTASPLGWRREDWFNKRLAAWANLRLCGRGIRFRQADHLLTRLVREIKNRGVDHVVCSGDVSALGFEAEFKKAAALLEIDRWPGLAIPGNHDYCTIPASRSGSFERTFAPWQQGIRIDGHTYPFAQRVGPVWLIALNSSTGNRWAWDAGGAVGPDQLERLIRLAQSLDRGPRLLVTHFPVCLADGQLERRTRGLRNMPEVVATAASCGIQVWLHGHRHKPYIHQQSPHAPFPIICSGSGTQSSVRSYNEYAIDGSHLRFTRRVYYPDADAYRDEESKTFDLKVD